MHEYYWLQCLFFVNLDLLEYFVTIFYNKLTELLYYLVRRNRFLLVIDIILTDLNAASDKQFTI